MSMRAPVEASSGGHSCMTWIPTGVLIGKLCQLIFIESNIEAVHLHEFGHRMDFEVPFICPRFQQKCLCRFGSRSIERWGFLANWILVSLDISYEAYGECNFHTNNQPQYRSFDLLQ